MKTIMSSAADRLIVSWPVLLFVAFGLVLTPPVTAVGYLWLEEFALAAFLFVALVFVATGKASGIAFKFTKTELIWIVLPMVLFTIWSGLSYFWARSGRNAMHHTLLWACYTIFYFLIRLVIEDKKSLNITLNITRYVVFLISAICIIEFLLSSKQSQAEFLVRYYPYSEISITLLPILLVLVVDNAVVQSIRWILFSSTVWCSMVVTASRTVFVAGVGSILMFAVLSIILNKPSVNVRRWLAFIGLVTAITLGSQMLLKADTERALFQRFAGTDKTNVQNAGLRLFYWGMALEGFKASPVVGIGGDNYLSEYKLLRERYTTAHPENQLLEIGEDLLPERAHNEYLQIMCELGSVGSLLFGWLVAGIAYMMFIAIRKRAPLITLGALAGLASFLVASFATSYSFRIPINGLCFFFLIAVSARELFTTGSRDARGDGTESKLKPLFVFAGLFVSLSMLIFSTVRAFSISHFSHCEITNNRGYAVAEITKAIALDPSEPMFRFSYGQELFFSGRYDTRHYDEAMYNFRLAIQNGFATTPVYFNLLASEMLARRPDDAVQTFSEALSVYPRSVFLLTAHAAFLKREGDPAAADHEYQKAMAIDPMQAISWQLAHEEGLDLLEKAAHSDTRFLETKRLIPFEGSQALLAFQRQP